MGFLTFYPLLVVRDLLLLRRQRPRGVVRPAGRVPRPPAQAAGPLGRAVVRAGGRRDRGALPLPRTGLRRSHLREEEVGDDAVE